MGTRNARGTSPPAAVNVCLKYVSESWPGAKSETTVATFLRPCLAAQSAMITTGAAWGKLERTIYGERDRGEPETGKNIHLVAGQKLLGNAPAVVGNAGVVAQDELDLPAVNRGAVLLHVEPGARFDLLARGRERPRHGKNETDLDGLFGHCVRRGQRDGCDSGQCPPHERVLQSVRDQRNPWRFAAPSHIEVKAAEL